MMDLWTMGFLKVLVNAFQQRTIEGFFPEGKIQLLLLVIILLLMYSMSSKCYLWTLKLFSNEALNGPFQSYVWFHYTSWHFF